MPSLKIDIARPDFEALGKAIVNKAHKVAGTEAMEEFARTRLDSRFTGRASSELKFEQRDAWYQDVKQEEKGRGRGQDHNWSGRSRQKAKSNWTVKVTPKRMRVILRGMGPQYGRRRSATIPDLRGELQRISENEVRHIAKQYRARLIDYIATDAKAQARLKRRIR